jgi:hypothetical protein
MHGAIPKRAAACVPGVLKQELYLQRRCGLRCFPRIPLMKKFVKTPAP